MKNCKMAFTIGLVFAIMMLVAACTDSNKSDNHIFDHESLDVMNMCIRLILILEMI